MRKYMSRSKQIIYLCNITMKLHFNLLPNDYSTAEVQRLAPSFTPPIPSTTPSTSTSTPSTSSTLPTTGIPPCPMSFKPDRIRKYSGLSDEEFLSLAANLKAATDRKAGVVKTFMDNTPVEYIAASIKRSVYIQLTPPQNWP